MCALNRWAPTGACMGVRQGASGRRDQVTECLSGSLCKALHSDPLQAFEDQARVIGLQREEPVGAVGLMRGIRHQADVRFGYQR